MDERSLAEQIEASKDDPDAWGDVEPAPVKRSGSERRQRGAVVSVRLTAEELARIQDYADEASLSLSGALRAAALAVASAAAEQRTTTRRLSVLRPPSGDVEISSAGRELTYTTKTNVRLFEGLASVH